MRRRAARRPSPAVVLREAAEAGVDDMNAADRRAWLYARGWTSLEHIRAQLAQRRTEQGRATW